jgi:hypothetical protein
MVRQHQTRNLEILRCAIAHRSSHLRFAPEWLPLKRVSHSTSPFTFRTQRRTSASTSGSTASTSAIEPQGFGYCANVVKQRLSKQPPRRRDERIALTLGPCARAQLRTGQGRQ